jgi:anhydro-N-acetylmuramic acid kinase
MKDDYKVIGLMSGTSLDGLDIAYCTFKNTSSGWQFQLEHSRHVAYDEERISQLRNAVDLPAAELLALDVSYGRWLGQQVNLFISGYNLTVDIVASHGHTIFHQPERGFTLQIGAGLDLAQQAKQTVVCDFRSLDVAMGGQGAPLVPIGDHHLFADYDFCLNLGGIANISFAIADNRKAYDVAPANMLLNYLAGQRGLAYDAKGAIAREGAIDPALLAALNGLEFYKLPYPKSLGYEWFVSEMQPIIDASDIKVDDKMATGVAHIAGVIAAAVLSEWNNDRQANLLITGGGAKNDTLIDALTAALGSTVQVILPSEELIDFKEAVIFAFMGVLRVRDEINCLSSVTGADRDVSGGTIFQPA